MTNKKGWWEKPGLGIMYQIEARPGWLWNRNYEKFNASMMDANGNLKFNGPFCKMKEWVAFSKRVGVDYHIFEAKWHDGICYFDTKYTNWKTPEDYCKILADESRKEGIPFMFYYSSIFDHNPQFDDIQPLRTCTPSFFSLRTKNKLLTMGFSFGFAVGAGLLNSLNRLIRKYPKDETAKWFDKFHFHHYKNNPRKYETYMFKQMIELIENYKPDGMWMDWYMLSLETSAHRIMDFMEKRYPDVILTFNDSIDYKLKYAHYTTFEAHDVKSAWRKGNKYRRKSKPWELVGPAANAWDNPLPRSDPYEAARIATIIMASGGKFAFGIPAQMNGDLYSEPARHLELFGKWYKERKALFTGAVPMDYKGKNVPGVSIKEKFLKTIGCLHDHDPLIHVISLFSVPKKDVIIKFSRKKWEPIEKIILEPFNQELDSAKEPQNIVLTIPKQNLERIDTILRIKTQN
ncbi:MAG: alpha-L-fucosidase [Promethearchaeota archaeon]